MRRNTQYISLPIRALIFIALFVSAATSSVFAAPTCSELGYTEETFIAPQATGETSYALFGDHSLSLHLYNWDVFDWQADAKVVGAIIVVGDNPDNYVVYRYSPLSQGATNLTAHPDDKINILRVCGRPANPTAAEVRLAGRVSDSAGKPIRRAYIDITDASTGDVRTVAANPFGHYQIPGLQPGHSYLIQGRAKGKTFQLITIAPMDSIADLNVFSLN